MAGGIIRLYKPSPSTSPLNMSRQDHDPSMDILRDYKNKILNHEFIYEDMSENNNY